jgi:hypothetical protein
MPSQNQERRFPSVGPRSTEPHFAQVDVPAFDWPVAPFPEVRSPSPPRRPHHDHSPYPPPRPGQLAEAHELAACRLSCAHEIKDCENQRIIVSFILFIVHANKSFILQSRYIEVAGTSREPAGTRWSSTPTSTAPKRCRPARTHTHTHTHTCMRAHARARARARAHAHTARPRSLVDVCARGCFDYLAATRPRTFAGAWLWTIGVCVCVRECEGVRE